MIYTSYYANHRNIKKYRDYGFKVIRISLWPPKYPFPLLDDVAIELAPSKELLLAINEGKITREEYDIKFNKKLIALNPIEIFNKYEGSIFLCYEKPSDHCHRHLIRDWLNQNGVECKELPNPSCKRQSVTTEEE